MSLVPVREYASAEEMLASYRERHSPKNSVIPMSRVRIVEPEPTGIPPNPAPEEIPEFLSRRKREDWIDLTSKAALRPATARVVLSVVCRACRVTHIDITSSRRTLPVVKARMIACWIMRHYTTMSFPQIGAKLGGRDHTTVLHSVSRVDEMRAGSALYRAYVDDLVEKVECEMRALSEQGETL